MGRARAAARIRELNDQCKAGLASNPKTKLHTLMSGELSAGLVAFEVEGVAPAEVVKQLLARKIIASTSPYAITYARLAPSLVNTSEEVERAVRGAGDFGVGRASAINREAGTGWKDPVLRSWFMPAD